MGIEFSKAAQRYRVKDDFTVEYTDPTGATHTATLDDLFDLLFYWQSRQQTIRRLVFEAKPLPVWQPMQCFGDFWLGRTADHLVRVSDDDFQREAEQVKQRTRSRWVQEHNEAIERRESTRRRFDAEIVYTHNSFGSPLPATLNEHVSEADCPPEVVRVQLQELHRPEYWVDRSENQERDTRVALP